MRRSTSLTLITVLAVLSLVVFASAQMGMMGNNKDEDSKGMHAKSGTMDMMMNMSKHCQMMSDDFDDLEKHFGKMMKMNNMSELKSEMQKHHQMMSSMHGKMDDLQKMCGKTMMSSMKPREMQGHMMGSTSGETSEKGDTHGHDH